MEVLDSMTTKGPTSIIEIPTSSIVTPKPYKTRPNLRRVTEEMRQEADRLEGLLEKSHGIVKDKILPIVEGGWRVVRTRDRWEVDYGISQLFNPIPLNFKVEEAVIIKLNEMESNKFLNDTDEGEPLMMFYINDYCLGYPPECSEDEQILFIKQLSSLSRKLYRTIYEAAGRNSKIIITDLQILEFSICEVGGDPIRISLKPNKMKSDAIICRKLSKAFLEQRDGEFLLNITLSMNQ